MNLQEKIRDLALKLYALYLVAIPPDDEAVEKLITALDAQSIAALKLKLDEDTVAFKDALEALDTAKTDATNAITELEKMHQAIASSVKVVQILDQLLEAARSLIK